MMPRNVVKSGTASTLLSSVMIAVPMPMPNRAMPTGKPMASTEPNATIRMMIANARPSTSVEGGSNSREDHPAELDLHAVDLRRELLDLVADLSGAANEMLSGSSTLANAISPGFGPLQRDLRSGARPRRGSRRARHRGSGRPRRSTPPSRLGPRDPRRPARRGTRSCRPGRHPDRRTPPRGCRSLVGTRRSEG